MRDYPLTIEDFKDKHQLKDDISASEFFALANKNVVLRHDFAYISLYNDLKSINNELELNSSLEKVFPRQDRIKKWKQFQNRANLNIENLEPPNSRILPILFLFIVLVIYLTYELFTNQDFSFFTLLHPETIGMMFLAFFGFFGVLDLFISKKIPNNSIPGNLESKNINELINKIIKNNRKFIKTEFSKLYQDKFAQLINETPHNNGNRCTSR